MENNSIRAVFGAFAIQIIFPWIVEFSLLFWAIALPGAAETLRWKHVFEDAPQHVSLAAEDLVYVGSDTSNYLHAVSMETGNLVWKRTLGSPLWGNPVQIGTTLAIAPKDQSLVGLRTDSGEPLWWLRPRFPPLNSLARFSVPNLNRAPAVVWQNSFVYLSLRGILTQLNSQGQVLSSSRIQGGDLFWARPAQAGNSLFAASREGQLLELQVGAPWRLLKSETLPAPPRFPGGNEVLADLTAFGNRVFVTTLEGTVHCRSASGGHPDVHWSRPLARAGETVSSEGIPVFQPVCDEAGNVYTAYGRRLIRLGGDFGDIQWTFEGTHSITTIPTYAGGRVYATDASPALLTLDAKSGRLLDKTPLEDQASGGPQVGSEGIVVGLRNGSLLCFWP